jgi:Kef-type K+ transport system membrane component KefB
MDLFYVLLILLVVTRALGEVAERLGQPALVGELISGVLLGTLFSQFAELFPTLSGLGENRVFNAIADLGMFFIMLFAGIEMQPRKLLEYSGQSLAVAVGGMGLPLALGVGLGLWFLPESDIRMAQALFVGTALAITAVPATVRILMDLDRLNTPSGQIIVSAAVADDVMSLLLLAWLTGLITAGGAPGVFEIAVLAGKIVLFFAITAFAGLYVFPWGGKYLKHVKGKEIDFSLVLIGALAFAVLAELLDLHFILGAFVAGVFFGRKTVDEITYERVRTKVSGMTFGFLAPIFFASVGMNMDIRALSEVPVFLVLLTAFALVGKLLGSGLPAYWLGLGRRDALAVGIGMSARGAVELVIVDIALRAGMFSVPGVESAVLDNLFSAVVVMAIITTLATPIVLRWIYMNDARPPPARE